jgi:hypothetical protein
MPPKTTRNAAMVAAYIDGASQAALAIQHGITRQRVGRILRRAGHGRGRGRRPLPLRNPDERSLYEKARDIIGIDAARQAYCLPGVWAAPAPPG